MYTLWGLFVLFVISLVLIQPLSTAMAQTDTPTPTATATATATPTQTLTPTAPPAVMVINAIEPAVLNEASGGTLTVLGSGFTSDTLIRLIGFGVLGTNFFNEGTLQGTVPPGVPPGGYTVEVFNSATSATSAAQLQISAAAPVGPTATPPPGNLSVGAVEPSEVVKATGTTITVFGGGFTPDAIVRLVGVGALDTIYLSDTTLKAVVPPDLPAFQFDLQVIRGNDVATWGGKVTIFVPPTATPKPGNAGTVLTQPQLLVQNTVVDRTPIRPGEPFTLSFDLVNVGGRDAQNVVMSLVGSEVAVPNGGSNTRFIDRVDDGGENAIRIDIDLIARTALTAGQYNLPFDFEFLDSDGRSYATTQQVGLTVGDAQPTPTSTATPVGAPRLIITTYEADRPIEPGGRFALNIVIDNVGTVAADDVTLTFGGESGQLGPFALLNAGNVAYIASIPAGETVLLERQLITDGDAAAQPYSLPLTLQYEDGGQNATVNPFLLSLLVENRPKFQIGFYRQPAVAAVGEPLDLPVEIVNIGSSTINVNTIVMETDPPLVVEDGSLYSGPLDGGTSITLDGLVFPETSGELVITVLVNYLDDFNQQQQLVETLTIEVAEGFTGPRIDPETGEPLDPAAGEQTAGGGSTSALFFQIGGALLALIFIGFVVRSFRRRRTT